MADGAKPRTHRRPRRDLSGRTALAQLPWTSLRNPYAPTEVVSADQIEAIHEASLQILKELGVVFLLPEALAILARAGAEVDHASGKVFFDRELIERSMASAPQSFVLHARNPLHNLTFGANHINFGSVGSPPNVSDLKRGRRTGNRADFLDLVRLVQSLNIVHFTSGYPVEPVDLPPSTRHLDALHAVATLTDKVFHAYSLGRERVLDGLEIARLARGLSPAQLREQPSLFTVVNTNSPLQIDAPMLQGIIEMARHGQAVVVTPFTLSGAMAPATVAGALAQQNAEALAGMSFAQIVKAGTPVIYGGFTSNVDMRSGAPAFGTPEYSIAALVGGQLARRYQVPYRSSNVNASNAVDAQAAYESQMSLWAAVMGHANMVLHGAGWMEGGLTASFEKMIIDAEMLQMMAKFMQPLVVDEDSLALDAIREVGHGGHFFGAAHTMARYENAFYRPMVSDWRNHGSWTEAGSPDAAQRAHGIYKDLLASYEPPPMPADARLSLDEFVARRKAEGGVPGA